MLRMGLVLSLSGGRPSNAAPTDILLSAATVDEDADLGHVVGALSATDPEDDAVTFSLIDDAGGLFGIDGNNLIVTGVLDYETAGELGGGGGGAPEWLEDFRAPSDDLPTQAMDFLGADYWNGAEVAVTTLINDRDTAPADEFDPATIVADGVQCFSTNTSVMSPVGDLLTKLKTNNWTVVIEWKTNVALDQDLGIRPLLTALNNLDDGDEGFDLFIRAAVFENNALKFNDYDSAEVETANQADDDGGVNKAAFTFTSTKVSLSLNGGVVATFTDPILWDTDWLIYTIGKADGGGLPLQGWIRKFAIYDPQPDVDLPALSTVA